MALEEMERVMRARAASSRLVGAGEAEGEGRNESRTVEYGDCKRRQDFLERLLGGHSSY